MKEYTIIKDCEIYTPEKIIKNGSILIEGEKIARVGKFSESELPQKAEIFSFKNHLAVPGFIDIHLHGGANVDFMTASAESTAKALRAHLKNGTTSLLPTTMTASHRQTLRAIENLIQAKKSFKDIPEVLGLNLEGPYISEEKCGAQPNKFIRRPSLAEMKEYIQASEREIKIMTIAPEIKGALRFICFLVDQNIIPSAGHTNADYRQIERAIKSGVRLATHLFNAMKGILHREPGAAGALLINDDVSVEVIADGIHLHPSILSLIARVKPLEKIILVTDASKFYGVKHGAVYNQEGKLFGSTVSLNSSLKNMIQSSGKSFQEILTTITSNPAKLLNIQNKKGHLKKGNDADIVILDKRLAVQAVFLKGHRSIPGLYEKLIKSSKEFKEGQGVSLKDARKVLGS
jgi:N-acetylglucosamine-6-phosphate deacetylase